MRANAAEVDGGLLTDDLELLLREINDFCGSNAGRGSGCIPKSLDDYLLYVAKTGNTVFPWNHVRSLFRLKLELAISQFPGEPSALESTVFERFDLFRSAPFTIQRLSELITEPNRHYKMKEKYMFALEKTVFVVSTVEPLSADFVNNGDSTEDLELESSNEFTEENANTLNASFIQHESSSEESQLAHFDGAENAVKEMEAQPQQTIVVPEANFIVAELSVEVPAQPVEELTALEPNTEEDSPVGSALINYAEVESDVKEMDTQPPTDVVVQESEFIVTELVEPEPIAPTTEGSTELELITAESSLCEAIPTPFDEVESDVKELEAQNQLPLGDDLIPEPSFSASELVENVPVEQVDDSIVMETDAEDTENGPEDSELTTLEEVKGDLEEESIQPPNVEAATPEEPSLIVSELSEEVPVGQVEDSAAVPETTAEG